MKNLFLIDGASGSGKSDLVQYALDFKNDVCMVPKYSTRDARAREQMPGWKLDLTLVAEEAFSELQLDYVYSYGGKKYGLCRTDLLKALEACSNVFVIVRNAEVIDALKKEFEFINVVPMYVYTDLDQVRKRLKRERATDEEIKFRIGRHKMAFVDYLTHPTLYREVLINNSSREDYHRLIHLTLEKYRNAPDVDDKLVFLLMSFQPDNLSLPDYAAAIKRGVRNYNAELRCVNLDDVHKGSYAISAEAKAQISQCRLAIVDLTDNRPNVYYELGFTSGVRKDYMLTCHIDTKPHFHPAGHRILFYRNATELEKMVTTELTGILSRKGRRG